MLKVCKFGGSSLSSDEQFKKVKKIVTSDPLRKAVVVSAIGKRNSEDSKITDLLYILHAHLKYNVPYDPVFNLIRQRFVDVKVSLGLTYDIEKDFDLLKSSLSKNTAVDFLVSRGEYFTAKMMSEYLGYTFVDAKDVIKFNYQGEIDLASSTTLISQAFKKYDKIIIPGFYGSYPNGEIKLLARGGSDVTASIVSRAIMAKVYENFTDVSGVLMADPRIVKNPISIPEITFTELRELSYMGANVIHEDTIYPVLGLDTVINIKNTNDPDHPGTLIKANCNDSIYPITGISGMKDFTSITISKNNMSHEMGFIRKTLTVFEKYKINIEHIPSSIDAIDVIVRTSDLEHCLYELVADLKEVLHPDDVVVTNELALVAVIGRNMNKHVGLCSRIFDAVSRNNISVRMIAQATTELNVIIGVENKDFKTAISSIYNEFIK